MNNINKTYGMMVSGSTALPTFQTGVWMHPLEDISVPQHAPGPAARAYIIHPDDLAAMIAALSDRDPIKACDAKESLEVLLTKVFPTIGEFYVSSADHPGRSVAEVKLMGLGLLS